MMETDGNPAERVNLKWVMMETPQKNHKPTGHSQDCQLRARNARMPSQVTHIPSV